MKVRIATIKNTVSIVLTWLVVAFSVISIMSNNGWNVALPMPLYLFEIIVLGFLFLMNNTKYDLNNIKWLLLFSVHILVCTLIGTVGTSTMKWYMTRTMELAFAPLIGYYFAQNSTENSRKVFYMGLYIATIGTIIYGFFNYFDDIAFQDRADSIFGHAIPYSTIVAMMLFMTKYLVKSTSIRISLNVVFILAAISTFSRSSWISIIIVFLILLIKNTKRSITRKGIIKLFVTGIVILAGMVIFREPLAMAYESITQLINNRISGTMGSISALQRLGTIGYMLFHIGLYGLLIGHGNGKGGEFLKNTTIMLSNFGTTDNQFISILYDFGIVGISLTLALLFFSIRKLLNSVINKEIQMLSCVIIAAYICSFFYELLGWINVAATLLILIGIFYYLCITEKKNPREETVIDEKYII